MSARGGGRGASVNAQRGADAEHERRLLATCAAAPRDSLELIAATGAGPVVLIARFELARRGSERDLLAACAEVSLDDLRFVASFSGQPIAVIAMAELMRRGKTLELDDDER